MPEKWMLHLFIANFILIIVDAAVGYRVAPSLFRNRSLDEEYIERMAGSVRNTLTMVVALYMFFNCLAYFRGNSSLGLIVGGLVLADLTVQGWIYRKSRGRDIPE